MKILVVSTYPPMVCGVARYAEQQVGALRAEGHRVDVFSPTAGHGDLRVEVRGGLRPLRIWRAARGYDAVWIHYARGLYFRSPRGDQLLTSFAFWLLMVLAGDKTTAIVHEMDCDPDAAAVPGRQRRFDRLWWRQVGRVVFHSERERDAFRAYFGPGHSRQTFEVWPHERYFVRCCELDRAAARQRLGLAPTGPLLVSLGFLHAHKGFERVIDALARIGDTGDLRYRIVGAVQEGSRTESAARGYVRELHELAVRDPRVEVIEHFVSDDLFDLWIVASDYVVLPYRRICSSSVAARAKLYDRPLLAAAVGALPEQLTERSLLFATDEELGERLRQIAASVRAPGGG